LTADPFSWLAHRVPVISLPLINGVGRWNFLWQFRIQLSAYKTSRQVLGYSTRGTHLLGRSLRHLQLLGDTFARHIARLPRRRRETSFQASRWILNEGNIGQPRSAEPGPQLKSLLKCFPIILILCIFKGDGVVTFADFTAFFGLALALL
jgi:hypothetical protein